MKVHTYLMMISFDDKSGKFNLISFLFFSFLQPWRETTCGSSSGIFSSPNPTARSLSDGRIGKPEFSDSSTRKPSPTCGDARKQPADDLWEAQPCHEVIFFLLFSLSLSLFQSPSPSSISLSLSLLSISVFLTPLSLLYVYSLLNFVCFFLFPSLSLV